MNSSFQFRNFSEVDLDTLNNAEAVRRLPVVIFILILIVVGVFGNIHVLYIYYTKFGHSTYRIFVLSLAVVDITSCCVSMPFEIADELNPLNFRSEIACKIFRFLNTCFAMITSMMLVVIASERYRKICKPYGDQMTEQHSRKALIFVVGFATTAALPAIYVYGDKTLYIEEGGKVVTGNECTWADYVDEGIGYVYYAWALLIILICMGLLVVLYIFVGLHLRTHTIKVQATIRIKRRRKSTRRRSLLSRFSRKTKSADDKIAVSNVRKGSGAPDRHSAPILERYRCRKDDNDKCTNSSNDQNANSDPPETEASILNVPNLTNCPLVLTRVRSNTFPTNQLIIRDGKLENTAVYVTQTEASSDKERKSTCSNQTEDTIVTVDIDPPSPPAITRKGGTIMRKQKTFISEREQRITKVLFTITLLFIFSFLPYIIILIVYAVDDTYETSIAHTAAYPVYLMALRLYLVNNVANSLLYVLIDLKFRKHFIGIYKNLMK